VSKKKSPKIPSAAAVLAELKLRTDAPKFVIEEHCFKEQLDFIKDPDNFSTAVCSRRAGKTVACAADILNTTQVRPGTISLYITLSRASAKRIVWP
jgi:hypothetical protein